MRPDLRLFAGGEANFREKWVKRRRRTGVLGYARPPDAEETAAVETVCCEASQALRGTFTTGHIPRQSFERVLENTLVDSEGDASPSLDHFTDAERLGRLVPDQHPDEHATCYVVQGRGLVVISSCGHVGLINTIKAAMAVSGVGKLHAVLGGFHLGRRIMSITR